MATLLTQTRFTPEDVLQLEEEGLYELVGGQLVAKAMGSLASRTAANVTGKLVSFLEQFPLGELMPEQSFQCFGDDPERIRRPDIAFVSSSRAAGISETGHVKIAPDLAIEIVSPNDKIYELNEKLSDYRSAGVPLVWVIDPKSRSIFIERADRSVAKMFDGHTLTGEPVLPGFSVAVSDLIPRPL